MVKGGGLNFHHQNRKLPAAKRGSMPNVHCKTQKFCRKILILISQRNKPAYLMLKSREAEMTIFGYARVSTDGQTVAAQVAQLRAAGAAKVYSETASGAKSNRAELAKVMRVLQPGDVLIVTRLDRLARSTRDLLNTLHALGERQIGF